MAFSLLICAAAAVLLAAGSSAAEGECYTANGKGFYEDFEDSPNTDDDNGDCSFYDGAGGSCCKERSESDTSKVEYFPAPDLSGYDDLRTTLEDGTECAKYPDGCVEMISLYTCGIYCSPNNGKFTELSNDNRVITICKGFADRLYEACKDAEASNDADDKCVKVGDKYDDGTAFITNDGDSDSIKVDDEVFSDSCFNAAEAMVASTLLLLFSVSFASFW